MLKRQNRFKVEVETISEKSISEKSSYIAFMYDTCGESYENLKITTKSKFCEFWRKSAKIAKIRQKPRILAKNRGIFVFFVWSQIALYLSYEDDIRLVF